MLQGLLGPKTMVWMTEFWAGLSSQASFDGLVPLVVAFVHSCFCGVKVVHA